VYVGSTRGSRHTIREELVRHLHQQKSRRVHATHFSWEITFDPVARQRELVEEFQAVHRRPPGFNAARGRSSFG
jgi:Uri superfamily endonuclease